MDLFKSFYKKEIYLLITTSKIHRLLKIKSFNVLFPGMWVGPYEGKVVSLRNIKEIKDTSMAWEVIHYLHLNISIFIDYMWNGLLLELEGYGANYSELGSRLGWHL